MHATHLCSSQLILATNYKDHMYKPLYIYVTELYIYGHVAVWTSVSQPFCGGGRALEDFFKTRILLVGFGYNETNLESFTKLTARSWAGSGRCRGCRAL